MAGFTDTLRGDGLTRGNPLDRKRQQFSHPPPPYTSAPSSTTIRSVCPDPPSEEQQRHLERRVQLKLKASALKLYYQFKAQVEEERRRIWNADPQGQDRARHLNNKWNQLTSGQWKHEEPLKLESESDSEIAERRVVRDPVVQVQLYITLTQNLEAEGEKDFVTHFQLTEEQVEKLEFHLDTAISQAEQRE
ncbi:MAG: hypothetical protein M1834_008991 [Cirrosporium novae-zelandiae]|nr:MAG: hypothetical protein M1834_008991 [Cirrosporium novae-zelandiae]